jgi:DNA invertase Pin-like site-specific DNA recombinase
MVQRVALYTRVSTSDQSCEEFGKNRTLTRYAATILDELTHNVLENTIGLAQVQAPHHRQ